MGHQVTSNHNRRPPLPRHMLYMLSPYTVTVQQTTAEPIRTSPRATITNTTCWRRENASDQNEPARRRIKQLKERTHSNIEVINNQQFVAMKMRSCTTAQELKPGNRRGVSARTMNSGETFSERTRIA